MCLQGLLEPPTFDTNDDNNDNDNNDDDKKNNKETEGDVINILYIFTGFFFN
jgi:hypothetical protein